MVLQTLVGKGYDFKSETDTEVLCHLIKEQTKKYPFEDAVREAMKKVRGSYALIVIKEDEPLTMVGIRKDSLLVVGSGDGEFFLASDVPAFLNYSKDVIFLEDGEMAVLTDRGLSIMGPDSIPLQKEVKSVPWSLSMAEKGGYKHFLLKEIYEQPRAIGDTLRGRLSLEEARVNLDEFGFSSDELKKVLREGW